MMYMMIFIAVIAHMYLTLWLVHACHLTHGENFVKKFKILLWIPIINYIFVFSKEGISWLKSYRDNLKNL